MTTATREPTRVVTVRMPNSLHKRLLDAAYAKRVSANAMCVEAIDGFVQVVEAHHDQDTARSE